MINNTLSICNVKRQYSQLVLKFNTSSNIYAMKWPQTLRYFMDETKDTQESLAEKLNCSQGMIGFYLRDEKFPRRKMLEAMASYFNVQTEHLISFQKDVEQNADKSHAGREILARHDARVLPILKNSEIIDWLQNNILPSVERRYSMLLPQGFNLSEKAYLLDITDDYIATQLFPIKMSGMKIYAVVDPEYTIKPQDMVVASINSELPKIRQYIVDGSESAIKSFDNQPPINISQDVKLLGAIVGYQHFSVNN